MINSEKNLLISFNSSEVITFFKQSLHASTNFVHPLRYVKKKSKKIRITYSRKIVNDVSLTYYPDFRIKAGSNTI